jgi:hypothetical protein
MSGPQVGFKLSTSVKECVGRHLPQSLIVLQLQKMNTTKREARAYPFGFERAFLLSTNLEGK